VDDKFELRGRPTLQSGDGRRLNGRAENLPQSESVFLFEVFPKEAGRMGAKLAEILP
jgi:hypothetical protein